MFSNSRDSSRAFANVARKKNARVQVRAPFSKIIAISEIRTQIFLFFKYFFQHQGQMIEPNVNETHRD